MTPPSPIVNLVGLMLLIAPTNIADICNYFGSINAGASWTLLMLCDITEPLRIIGANKL